jgi:hypothetical protein
MQNRLFFVNGRLIKFLFLFYLGLFCLLQSCTDENIPGIQRSPRNATLGSIDGVFVSATPSQHPGQGLSWELFRFYPDGLVLNTGVIIEKGNIAESWPSINKWFNRKNIKLENSYYVLNNNIWFRTQGRTGNQNYVPTIDWWGTFTNQTMTLYSYSHKTKIKRTEVEYVRLPIN